MLSDLILFSLVLIMSCNQFQIFLIRREREERKGGRRKREGGTEMFIRKKSQVGARPYNSSTQFPPRQSTLNCLHNSLLLYCSRPQPMGLSLCLARSLCLSLCLSLSLHTHTLRVALHLFVHSCQMLYNFILRSNTYTFAFMNICCCALYTSQRPSAEVCSQWILFCRSTRHSPFSVHSSYL